ncbi:hypothetical protein BDF14DRAFT_1112912 [Spinellus fusiger]|nr:hypothetical protein BDF14DRAFT_1112912 [Spinellus fusiger]
MQSKMDLSDDNSSGGSDMDISDNELDLPAHSALKTHPSYRQVPITQDTITINSTASHSLSCGSENGISSTLLTSGESNYSVPHTVFHPSYSSTATYTAWNDVTSISLDLTLPETEDPLVIDITHECIEKNNTIEELYGPFSACDKHHAYSSYTRPQYTASPQFSPRPFRQTTEQSGLAQRLMEIELLKKKIGERERELEIVRQCTATQSPLPQIISAPDSASSPFTANLSTVNKLVSPSEEIADITSEAAIDAAVEAAYQPLAEPSTIAIATDMLEKSCEQLQQIVDNKLKENSIQNVTDSFSLLNSESHAEDKTEEFSIAHYAPTESDQDIEMVEVLAMSSPILEGDSGMYDSDSDQSFLTAPESPQQEKEYEQERERELSSIRIRERIEHYKQELEEMQKRKEILEIRKLSLHVKMSIGRNRQIMASKQEKKPTEDIVMSLGDKRPNNAMEEQNDISTPGKRHLRRATMDAQLVSPTNSGIQGHVFDIPNTANTAPFTSYHTSAIPSAMVPVISLGSHTFSNMYSQHSIPLLTHPPAHGSIVPSNLSLPLYAPSSSPPPPPPSSPPPPPPPLPSSTGLIPTPIQSPRTSYSPRNQRQLPPSIQTSPIISAQSNSLPPSPTASGVPMVDGMKLGNYLNEVEELIKVRIGSIRVTDVPEIRAVRLPSRPLRLLTIDGMTLSLNSVMLEKEDKTEQPQFGMLISHINSSSTMVTDSIGQSIHSQESSEEVSDIAYESVLYNIIGRSESLVCPRMPEVQKHIQHILQALPNDFLNLIACEDYWGSIEVGKAKELAATAALSHPSVEILWDIYAELCLYQHGRTETFLNAIKTILEQVPLAFDVHWQRIRVAKTSELRQVLATNLLKYIAEQKAGPKSLGNRAMSDLTAEVVLRTLRREGLSTILKFLTGSEDSVNVKIVETFSLEESQSHFAMSDHDLYIVWMTILYYFLCNQVPSSICRHWISSLISKGHRPAKKPMFTLGWSSVAEGGPLTQTEQIGSINILLSMLRYFSKKARSNDYKRPLLMGVLRTLFDLLAHMDCYKRAGALALIRSGFDVEALRPEVYDIAAHLETQMGDHSGAIDRLTPSMLRLSLNQRLALAYRSARLLNPCRTSPPELLQEAARLAGLPLMAAYEMDSSTSLESGNVEVDFIRRLYLTVLGMDTLLPLPFKRSFKPREFRASAFAWINLIFLTQITRWIYNNPILENTLIQQLHMARDRASAHVNEEEVRQCLCLFLLFSIYVCI